MDGHVDITNIAIVVVAALACGLLLTRFRQPAIIGYILAGVILGPSGLALIEDREQVALLAELGVLMLLFIIGLELDLRAFRNVLPIALPAMLLQIGLGIGVTQLIAQFFDWSIAIVMLVGCAMALSSTAVAIKILESSGEIHTAAGRVAIGVLIAQDLAVVPMLLFINGLASGDGIGLSALAVVALSTIFLALFIIFLSRRKRMVLPFAAGVKDNIDLSALAAVTLCFAAAAATGLMGLSPAFGAFIAGLFIGNTDHRHEIMHSAQPVQSLTMMVFFLSVGLLIDIHFIWDNLLAVLGILALVTIGKTAANITILRLLRQPWQRAFLVGVVIGQVGEFSFVLAAAGLANGILSPRLNQLMVAVIALSLMSSPLWLSVARRLHGMARRNSGFKGFLRVLQRREDGSSSSRDA